MMRKPELSYDLSENLIYSEHLILLKLASVLIELSPGESVPSFIPIFHGAIIICHVHMPRE
jgi:hypothetical protein